MLVAHHIVDVLRGRVKNPPILSAAPIPSLKRAELLASMIARSEKFDFGRLPFEPLDLPNGEWKMPQLTPDELDFWAQDLIPLPHPVCWYEWTLGGSRSGLLVYENEAGSHLLVERVDWNKDQGVVWDGFTSIANKRARVIGSGDNELAIEVDGDRLALERYQNNERLQRVFYKNSAMGAPLAIYLTLMLYSRTTEIVKAPAPEAKLQKRRLQRGREPLPAHRIVTIVPGKWVEQGEHKGGTHRPPRIHWRRSHKRHFESHTLRSKWVPNEVWKDRTGWWVAVVPRCLVGRAEMGEVSHEYRIVREEQEEVAP